MKKQLWRDELDVDANLSVTLPKLAKKYFAAGNQALAPGKGWAGKHKFRLATKRFRYTLELFRDQYGPSLQERIDALKRIQDGLGKANDYIETAKMLKDISGTEQLRAHLTRKAETKLKQLESWWGANMGTDEVEQRWIVYLQRFAGRPSMAQPEPMSGEPPSQS